MWVWSKCLWNSTFDPGNISSIFFVLHSSVFYFLLFSCVTLFGLRFHSISIELQWFHLNFHFSLGVTNCKCDPLMWHHLWGIGVIISDVILTQPLAEGTGKDNSAKLRSCNLEISVSIFLPHSCDVN